MIESIVSDQKSKSVVLVPGPSLGNIIQMPAAVNEGVSYQIYCGKMNKQHPGFPATLSVWRL